MANSKNYVHGSVAVKIPSQKQREENIVKKNNINKINKAKPHYKKFITMVICISIFSIFTLVRYVNILKLNSDIRSIKKEIKLLQNENENINVELANLNKIKNIDKIAIEKYGMIIPHPSDINYIDVKPLTFAKEEIKQERTLGYILRLLGLIY